VKAQTHCVDHKRESVAKRSSKWIEVNPG
jgi:hypothetical protein